MFVGETEVLLFAAVMNDSFSADIVDFHNRQESYRFYILGLMLTPVSLFGLIGNCLSIIVLSSLEMQNSFNHLLIALATFDLLYLLIALLIFALPTLSQAYNLNVLPFVMPMGFGFAHIGRVGSVMMTLSVTVERFFAVVFPLNKIRRSTSLISVSVLGSIVYNIPRFFEMQSRSQLLTQDDDSENITMWVVMPSELRTNQLYVLIYVVWMKLIVVELIPYILIMGLNGIMICKIRQAMRLQKVLTSNQDSTDQKKEYNMAIVLVCIVIMFILCQSIKIIPDLFEAMTCDHSQTLCETNTFIEIIEPLSKLMLAVNSASNFIIYMLRGDKFRKIFVKTFNPFRGGSRDSNPISLQMQTRMTGTRTQRHGSTIII